MGLNDARTGAGGVGALLEVGAVGGLPDGELLGRFAARGDGAAFAALVARHGPMVWGVCRRTLRDHHDAEDAYQAAFLVLARRAGSVRPRDRVGPWLHGVAVRTAARARGRRARRRTREAPGITLPDHPAPAPADRPDDLLERLDGEVARLPERLRAPVVLCELEGLTYREAADRLGWPIGTVSGRLTRARALLARRLGRPGPSRSLGVFLAPAAPPARLAGPIVRAGVALAADLGPASGGVSPGAVTLMRGVLATMRLARIQLAALPLLAASALLGGIGLARLAPAADPPRPAPPAPTSPPPRPEAALPASPAPQEPAVDPMKPYAFTLDGDDAREYEDFHQNHDGIVIEYPRVTAIPIVTERGVTGAMLWGEGRYFAGVEYKRNYSEPRTDAVPFVRGTHLAAMIRFNPSERATILPTDKGKKVPSDRAVLEICRQLLATAVRHCYQSNGRTPDGGRRQDVLIPPPGAFAAVLYTREHGDLLISGTKTTGVAHSFTDGKTLFEKK